MTANVLTIAGILAVLGACFWFDARIGLAVSGVFAVLAGWRLGPDDKHGRGKG